MAVYVKYQIGTEVLAEAANSGTDSWRVMSGRIFTPGKRQRCLTS